MAKTYAELYKQREASMAERKSTYMKGGTFSDIIDVAQTPQYWLTGLLSGKGAKVGRQQRMMPSEHFGVKGIPGFALDVVSDPLSWLSMVGSTSKGIKALGTAGDVIDVGTKAGRRAEKAITLGAAAKRGQKAVLTLDLPFMKGGIPLLPKAVSETILGVATKIAQPIRKILGERGTTALRMLSAAPPGATLDEIEALAKAEGGVLDFLKNLSASERAGFSKMFNKVRDINKSFNKLAKDGLLTPEDVRKIADKMTVDEARLIKEGADIKLSSQEAENLFKQSEEINSRLQIIRDKYGAPSLEGKKLPLILQKETKEYLDEAKRLFGASPRKWGKADTKFAEHIRFEPISGNALIGTSEKLGLEQYENFVKKFTQEKGALSKRLSSLLKQEQALVNKIGKKAFMSADQVLDLAKKRGIKVEGLTANKIQTMMQTGKIPSKFNKLRALFKIGGERAGKVKGAVGEMGSKLKGIRETIAKKEHKLKELIAKDRRLEQQAYKLGADPGQIFVGKGPSGPRLYKRTAVTATEANIAAGRPLFKTDAPLEQLSLKARQTFKKRSASKFINEFTTNAEKFGGVKIVDGEVPPGMARSTLPELKGLAFPESVVKIMDSTFEKFSTMESVTGFLKKFDSVQNAWKKTATFWNPAFHFRNWVSNNWQLYLADALDPRDALTAAKMFKNRKALDKAIATKAFKELSKEEKAWRLFTDDFGLGGTGWVGGDIEQQLTKLKINPMDKLGGKVGEIVEDSAKLQLFMNRLRKGYRPEEAAMDVRKFMFDYGDLSDVERQFFKRALPFYTWTRNNIPLQISMLIQKPGKFSVIDKIKRAHESTIDDERMDEKYLPEWMKEAYPVYFGKDGKGLQRFFAMEGFLPAVDLNKLGRPSELFVDLMSPLIKTPLELAMNYDTFQERQIKEFEGQRGELFGQEVPKTVEKLAKSFRPLTEMERIFKPKLEYGETPSIPSRLRTYLFGKVRAYDESKQKDTYDYLQSLELRKISAAIKRAQKSGNNKAVARLKELLKETKSQKS